MCRLPAPLGPRELARRFYGDGLGLVEVEKPEDLKRRGGAVVPGVRRRGDGDRRDPYRRRGLVRSGSQRAPGPAVGERGRPAGRGGAVDRARLPRGRDPTTQLPGPRALPYRRQEAERERSPLRGVRGGLDLDDQACCGFTRRARSTSARASRVGSTPSHSAMVRPTVPAISGPGCGRRHRAG